MMANVNLLTVFSSKAKLNLINKNYSIFKRPTNLINTTYLVQSREYVRGNVLQRTQGQINLFGNELKSTNIIKYSLKINSFANKPNHEQFNIDKINEKKSVDTVQNTEINAGSIFYKSIAYLIYGWEIFLQSNELKLIKQLLIKGYVNVNYLFNYYVLEHPNIKAALNDVKGKSDKKSDIK